METTVQASRMTSGYLRTTKAVPLPCDLPRSLLSVPRDSGVMDYPLT